MRTMTAQVVLQSLLLAAMLYCASSFSLEEEEAAIQLARERFFHIYANYSDVGDADIDGDIHENRKNWWQSWSYSTLRNNYGCTSPSDSSSLEGCFSDKSILDPYADRSELGNLMQYIQSITFKGAAGTYYSSWPAEHATEFAILALENLADRGINETSFNPGLYDANWDSAGYLLFADEDGNYDSSYSQVHFANRNIENILGKCVLLLRDRLKPHVLDALLGALRTLTKRWGHGEPWLEDDHWFQTGMNSDQSRIMIAERLHYVLALNASGDQFGNRSQHLSAWRRWAERSMLSSDTVFYGLKPDGTLHHHQMVYGNGYAVDILPWATWAAYMLHGSPWALDQSTVENLARATSTVEAYTSGRSSPRPVGGRLVDNDATLVRPALVCASSFLATLASAPDAVRSVAAATVWGYTDREVLDYADNLGFWTTTGSETKPHTNPPGCIRQWYEARRARTREAALEAEAALQRDRTTTVLPYAGVALYRPGGRGGKYTVVLKGFGREVKNSYERSSSENFHGQYQSAGVLWVWADSSPVDPLAASSSYAYAGFDWYRVPGVTAPHWSAAEVASLESTAQSLFPTSNVQSTGFFPRTYSGSTIPYARWAESDEAFVGGVMAASEAPGAGLGGAWGFRMEDPVNLEDDVDEFLRTTLTAYKTAFFFAPPPPAAGVQDTGFVLALASGISSRTDSPTVETTLFQQFLTSSPADYPVEIDGSEMAAVPYEYASGASGAPNVTRLRDAEGHGYVVTRRGNSTLKVLRQSQTNPRHNSYVSQETASYGTALLDHGVRPQNDTYEYALLLNATSHALAQFSPRERYNVLSLRDEVHAVKCMLTGAVAAVFFRPAPLQVEDGAAGVGEPRGYLQGSDTACAVVVQPQTSSGGSTELELSVGNPELGFLNDGERFNTWSSTARVLYTQRSQAQNTTLRLDGAWRLKPGVEPRQISGPGTPLQQHLADAEVMARAEVDAAGETTSVWVHAADGASVAVRLEPAGVDCAVLAAGWNHSAVQQCALALPWDDPAMHEQLTAGAVGPPGSRAWTGGLGRLMDDQYEVWLCVEDHECARDATVGGGGAFCFVYDELGEGFVPWGSNACLQLVSHIS